MIGTVQSFDPRRGFGFIRPADGRRDVIVDRVAVELAGLDQLREGDRLQFRWLVDRASRKPRAVDISVAE
jgi:CspA family cold shock protein